MNRAKTTQVKSFLATGLKPALLATAILLLAAALPTLAGTGNVGNPGILPPQSHAFGKTYAEWSVNYWQWVFSLPATNSPILDTGDCSAGQSGPVWFVAGTFGCTTNTRSCTILMDRHGSKHLQCFSPVSGRLGGSGDPRTSSPGE